MTQAPEQAPEAPDQFEPGWTEDRDGFTVRAVVPLEWRLQFTANVFAPANGTLARLVPDDRPTQHVVADESVWAIYGPAFMEYHDAHDITVHVLQIPAGEAAKTRETANEIRDRLREWGVGRGGPLLSFGGGATHDVVGHAASDKSRGIVWDALNSTLLAAIDARAGLKVGINVGTAKNTEGDFFPPRTAITDPALYKTVPREHNVSAMGEAFKVAVATDADLFALLENYGPDLIASAFQADGPQAARVLDELHRRAMRPAVEQHHRDPRDTEIERSLNLGHTFPKLELIAGIPHGWYVALDVQLSAMLAYQRAQLARPELLRIARLADSLGLPTYHDAMDDRQLYADALAGLPGSRGGRQGVPLPTGIGTLAYADDLTPGAVHKAAKALSSMSL